MAAYCVCQMQCGNMQKENSLALGYVEEVSLSLSIYRIFFTVYLFFDH